MKENLPMKPNWDFYHSFPFFLQESSEGGLEKSSQTGLSVYEDKEAVYVEAALPGIPTENIEIEYDNGYLTVKGEKKEEEKDKKYFRKSSSSFSYRVIVPGDIDESIEPDATYKDGIMKVKFKKGAKKKKVIKIKKG